MGKTKRPPAKKRNLQPLTDSWKPARRDIYFYHNGLRTVAVDPLEIYGRLGEYPELDTELKLLTLQSAMAQSGKAEAFKHVVEIVRKAFAVEPYTKDAGGKEHGLTNQECLELLAHFFTFMADLKKKAEPSPNGAPSGEPPASNSVTPNELGFTSIEVPLSNFKLRESPPA